MRLKSSLSGVITSVLTVLSASAPSQACTSVEVEPLEFIAYRSADRDSRGAAYAFERGNYEVAIHFAHAVLEGHRARHHQWAALTTLCASYGMQGAWDQAMRACDDVIEHHPTNWRAFNNRALLQAQVGRYGMALNDLREAQRLAPRETILEQNLASVACQAG